MSNGFPCPNPSCPHVFSAAAVTGATVLTCPRCATVFQFQTGGAAVASGASSAPAERSAAPSLQAPIPIAQPVASPPPELDINYLPSPVSLRQRARRRQPWGWQAVGGMGLLVGAIGLVLLLALRWDKLVPQKKTVKRTGEEVVLKASNFRYQIPASGWWQDDKMKEKLRYGKLVLHRLSPASWFAVLAKDFKLRNPRPKEMYAEGLYILEQQFKENLEHELREGLWINDRPAQAIVFRGQMNKQMYGGECWMFGHQGYGYWILSWSTGDGQKQLEADLADLRKRFTFGDERKTWEEKRPALREFVVAKASCRLTDTEGIWEEPMQPAADYDKTAVLALHALEQDLGADAERKRNIRYGPTFLVLQLPPAGGDIKSSVAAAREHLLAEQRQFYQETTMEPVSDADRPPGTVTAIGNARGHLGLLRVRNGETLRKFVVQAVIPAGDHILVLQGECFWNQRAAWEDAMIQLIESLKVGSGTSSKQTSPPQPDWLQGRPGGEAVAHATPFAGG